MRFALNGVPSRKFISDKELNEDYMLTLCCSAKGKSLVKVLEADKCWDTRMALMFVVSFGDLYYIPMLRLPANLHRELAYFL
jgi:hypothetical protein